MPRYLKLYRNVWIILDSTSFIWYNVYKIYTICMFKNVSWLKWHDCYFKNIGPLDRKCEKSNRCLPPKNMGEVTPKNKGNINGIGHTPLKTNMTYWNIPIFNRKYIDSSWWWIFQPVKFFFCFGGRVQAISTAHLKDQSGSFSLDLIRMASFCLVVFCWCACKYEKNVICLGV